MLILWNILIHDLVPFLVVSTVMLVTFTGGLYLLLQEERKNYNIVGVFNSTNQGQPRQRPATGIDNSVSDTWYIHRYYVTLFIIYGTYI